MSLSRARAESGRVSITDSAASSRSSTDSFVHPEARMLEQHGKRYEYNTIGNLIHGVIAL